MGAFMKLTAVQMETMAYCKKQIDDARSQGEIDLQKIKKRDLFQAKQIIDAQNGIVLTQGGNCTSRTLKSLEKKGLLRIIQDNSGIGTGNGAFPSQVQILNY